jgi:hypothetical protein
MTPALQAALAHQTLDPFAVHLMTELKHNSCGANAPAHRVLATQTWPGVLINVDRRVGFGGAEGGDPRSTSDPATRLPARTGEFDSTSRELRRLWMRHPEFLQDRATPVSW